MISQETQFFFIIVSTKRLHTGTPREILQGGTRLLLGPQGQAETSLKIDDLRSNKTAGKLS